MNFGGYWGDLGEAAGDASHQKNAKGSVMSSGHRLDAVTANKGLF